MALIESVDTSRMSEKQHAQYTLLRAELDYKHYLDTFDLDALNRALIYFEDHEDRERQMRTLFLRSVHEFDANDYIKSITSALRAERIAGQLHDTLFLAKINEHISFIYNRNSNCQGSKIYSYRAAGLYKSQGKESLFQACMVDYCLSSISTRNFNEAIFLLDSINSCIAEKDTLIKIYAEGSLAKALLETDRVNQAKALIDHIKTYDISEYPDLNLLFSLAIKSNDKEAAKLYLHQIIDSDAEEYHLSVKHASLHDYYKMIGETDSALYHAEKMYETDTETMLRVLDQSIVKAESNYYAENARLNKRIADRNIMLLVMSLAILLLVMVIGYFIYRWLNQRRKNEIRDKIVTIDRLFETIDLHEQSIAELTKEIENKKKELGRLTHSLMENQSAMTHMSEQVNRLYSEQYCMLNDIYNEYFNEGDPADSVKLTVYNRIHGLLMKMRDRNKILDLQRSLNHYCDNIISHLRADFPELKLDDITFLTLIIAGLAPKAVCMICNITMGNFYMKRRRFRQRVEQSDSVYKQIYLKYLNRTVDRPFIKLVSNKQTCTLYIFLDVWGASLLLLIDYDDFRGDVPNIKFQVRILILMLLIHDFR